MILTSIGTQQQILLTPLPSIKFYEKPLRNSEGSGRKGIFILM
jgi:hypothetical protein